MFHTFNFEAPLLTSGIALGAPLTQKSARRVNRSCVECTRRKIKCDRGHPCANCRANKLAPTCAYRIRSRRHAVSVNDLQEVSSGLEAHRELLSKLFPSFDIDDLRTKTRDQLLQILARNAGDDDHLGSESEIDDSGPVSENGEEPDRHWDELQPGADEAMKSSDDINAVSLAYDQHRRSYLGSASISAILRTIFRLCPAAKSHVAASARNWLKPLSGLQAGQHVEPTKADDERCINAYFECSHSVAPMLNEVEFISTWQAGNRQDASWLGLLNMVCTMGSIAAGDEHLHKLYYRRAQAHLTLETFGSGNLESVQALCVLAGCYLQYQNSPNMATAILGAAYRMALALGLHRESRKSNPHITSPNYSSSTALMPTVSRVEMRRRTWWCLFCFDVWTSMTMGRPTSGRWDPSTMDIHLPNSLDCANHAAQSLYSSARFCLIANRIQDRFAQIGRTTFGEVLAFDKELQDWHSSLPEALKAPSQCPDRLLIARDFMHNRYLNLRLILYRPTQLRRLNPRASIHEISQQELCVQATCHEIAVEAVESITKTWTPNRIHVWNASWYLFQAAMVPLLTLAQKSGEQGLALECDLSASKDILRKVLDLLSQMAPWMRSADRSRHIIVSIFDALSSAEACRTPSVSDGDHNFFGWYDDQVTFGDEIDWSAFLVDDETLNHGSWGTY
ncbi:uncharacterized protein A1O9_02924 [Exophiala aquamarina CBS 119918]|uniref:Zn(2)-C6 fungal-type domain-containing protein n=1 Tax=Exophiala aquamarina CBS 119918 TaxID=1182545 RepID=A0A072PPV6_9EURO|nr:uncharacterized protein A1O9_02924 [Exophiala aquamarina CBS 119918]KEF61358.1 hypothetical protein A1O9_02924 [Exophiala aquamarina CBS 119918]